MANYVRFGVGIDDQVSSPLQKIKDKFDQLGSSKGAQSVLQGVGVGLGVSAYGLLTTAIGDVKDAITSSITAAEAQQTAMVKLTGVLNAQGLAMSDYATQIDTAQKAGVALGFTVTDQTNQLALSVVATKNVTDALTLQRDAMDLARLKGVDLGTAELALNKAYDGTATALTKMGIIIPKGTKGLQALADVESLAGGQAQAFGDTAAGASAEFSAKIDALQVQIGTALLPVLAKMLTAAGNIATAIGDVIGKTQSWIQANQGLIDLSGPVNVLGDAWHNVQDAFDPIAAAADRAKTEVIGATRDMDKELADSSTVLGADAQDIGAAIADPLENAASAVVAIYLAFPGKLASALTTGQSAVTSASSGLANAIKDPISKQMKALNDILDGKTKVDGMTLSQALASQEPGIHDAAMLLRTSVTDQLTLLEDQAAGYGKAAMEAYAKGIGSTSQDIKDAMIAALKAARGVLQAFSPPGPESPLHLIDKWGEATGKAYADGLSKGIGGGSLTGALGGIAGSLAGGLGSIGRGGPVLAGAGASIAGPLVHIEHFHGTESNVQRLSEQLGNAVRMQLVRRS